MRYYQSRRKGDSHQIRSGLVGLWLWFYDGHLLPYSGKYQVRSAYNTQQRMPVPGRITMVACDSSGWIVDFEIQEGKGIFVPISWPLEKNGSMMCLVNQ